MVQNQGIEVYLTPLLDISKRYKEFPVPATSPSFTGNDNEAYIEAVDGERFMIVVDINEQFQEQGGARLRIECFLDGEFVCKQVVPHVVLREGIPPGYTRKGQYINDRAEMYIDGSLIRCGYAFASLLMGTFCTLPRPF